jgi:hypothetical protein
VAAYGGPQYQVTQQVMNRFAEAIQEARVDIVPRVMVGGGGGGEGSSMTSGNIMEGLLTLILSDKLGVDVKADQARERNPEADRLRNEIRQSMMEKREGDKPQSETPQSGKAPVEQPKTNKPQTPPAAPAKPA